MKNFRMRCTKSIDDRFKVGKVYDVNDNGRIIGDPDFNKLVPYGCGSDCFGDWHSACNWNCYDFEEVPALPRICYILGGEDTPLEVLETFNVFGYSELLFFYVQADGMVVYNRCDNSVGYSEGVLCDVINHPEKIIRKPKLTFTDDEKALMRLYVQAGCPWVARDKDNQPYVYESKPTSDGIAFFDKATVFPIPVSLISSITFENSPIYIPDYVEVSK